MVGIVVVVGLDFGALSTMRLVDHYFNKLSVILAELFHSLVLVLKSPGVLSSDHSRELLLLIP